MATMAKVGKWVADITLPWGWEPDHEVDLENLRAEDLMKFAEELDIMIVKRDDGFHLWFDQKGKGFKMGR